MNNPERTETDGVNLWVFRCEGPGPNGEGCPTYREDVASSKQDAENIALRGKWELVERHWHCPRCVQRVDDAQYGRHTRLETAGANAGSATSRNKRVGLTAITIENFKSIGEAVTIPLRPITLLFGANSVGKSTILQAMHYMHEVLAHRNPDPDFTTDGGLDLGGFRNLVHDHDLSRKIRLRFELTVDDDGLPVYPRSEFGHAGVVYTGSAEELEEFEGNPNADRKISESLGNLDSNTAWVEVECGWSEPEERVRVFRYASGLDGIPFAEIQYQGKYFPQLREVNWAHPFFSEMNEDDVKHLEWVYWGEYELVPRNASSRDAEFGEPVIPCFEGPFKLEHEEDGPAEFLYYAHFWGLMSQALIRPGELLLNELSGLRYVGPIRAIPPRYHVPPKRIDGIRWTDGMAAWDLLLGATEETPFLKVCNHHLRDTLQLGYTIERTAEIGLDPDGPVMADLRMLERLYEEKDSDFLRERVLKVLESQEPRVSLRLHDTNNDIYVHPRDIGVGVSQIVPVVMGLVAGKYSVFAVEQPELHVHPAVQARLADVFIQELLGEDAKDRIALIETHSEHFILRLLRRVRDSGSDRHPEGFPSVRPDDIQVLYLKSNESSLEVYPIAVTDDGDFEEDWPDGFFEERDEDLF